MIIKSENVNMIENDRNRKLNETIEMIESDREHSNLVEQLLAAHGNTTHLDLAK